MGLGKVWGRFVQRLNRFLISVEVGGRRELAHLPNPGRMRELLIPGRPTLLRHVSSPGRRTRWSAVGTALNGFLVSLDSTLPNRFLPSALREGWFPPLSGWRILRREPPLGKGRSDFLLGNGDR